MQDAEQQLQEQIIVHPLFQKLTGIIENYPGYHDNESTYDHLLKTADVAKQILDGSFITNSQAKEKFLQLVDQKIHGTKLRTIMLITALLHDCGKLLLYKEDTETKPLRMGTTEGNTPMPGHPFWGGRIVVPAILKDLPLTSSAKQMIADVIKVHDAYAEPYFTSKKDWSLAAIISDIKSGATGYYEEALFNQYCDCYSAEAFSLGKGIIEKVFNDPSFYNKRKYILP